MTLYGTIRTFANKLFGVTPPKPTYLIMDLRRRDPTVFGAVSVNLAWCRYVTREEFYAATQTTDNTKMRWSIDDDGNSILELLR